MHFSLRQIAVFDAVARLGSVSRAAEEIALSQSAASMALKELEESLGTQLFHRHGRKLVLNENGRRLHPKARSLLLLAEEIRRPKTTELQGTLRVAASATVGGYCLPECSAEFLDRHPNVRVEILGGTVPETVERVEAMAVDLGLIDTVCNRNSLQAEPIGYDRAVVFAAPSHPLTRKPLISIDDLRAAQWCLRTSPSLTRVHLSTVLGCGGLDGIRFVGDSYEAVKVAVKSGLGLGFASERVIAREVLAGELVVLPASSVALVRRFTLIVPKRVYQSALPRAFVDHLRLWFAREEALFRGVADSSLA